MAQLAAAALLTACGETNIAAIRRLQPAYAAHRSELVDALGRIPAPGEVRLWTVPESMRPPAVFSEDQLNDPRATAEILQIEDLEGRAASMRLSIRSPLHFCLAWTGPNNPLAADAFGDRGGLGEECAAAMARPWLILIRTVELRLPESLRMEAFIVDVRSKNIVAALPIDVWGRYTKADIGRGPWSAAAEPKVQSAFHQAASCELSMQLSRLPASSIHFDHRGCEGVFRDIAVPASLTPRTATPEPVRAPLQQILREMW